MNVTDAEICLALKPTLVKLPHSDVSLFFVYHLDAALHFYTETTHGSEQCILQEFWPKAFPYGGVSWCVGSCGYHMHISRHMIITCTACVYHMNTMQFSIMTLCYYYFRFVILRYLLVYWIISLHLTLIPSQNMPLKTSGATSYQGNTPSRVKYTMWVSHAYSVIITYCVINDSIVIPWAPCDNTQSIPKYAVEDK